MCARVTETDDSGKNGMHHDAPVHCQCNFEHRFLVAFTVSLFLYFYLFFSLFFFLFFSFSMFALARGFERHIFSDVRTEDDARTANG